MQNSVDTANDTFYPDKMGSATLLCTNVARCSDIQNEGWIHAHTRRRHGCDGAANCTADGRRTSWIHEKIPAPGTDKLALAP